MPRNEEGEYELVLGNRQLLSIFFIVVVLLGVGFTMGYILGRNSAPVTAAADTTTTDRKIPESAPPVTLDPPQTAKQAAVPPPEEKKAAEPPKQTTAQKPAGETKPYRSGTPPTGSVFIQVAAVSRTDAELEATTISKQGYPTWIAANEKNPELFSVLVGPYEDKGELAKAKASLEQLGFKKAFRKEYK